MPADSYRGIGWMGSRAYARLPERFGEVRTLLGLCSSPETKPEEHRAAARTDAALLRGALVLLCSHVEGFFEDLVEDALRAFDLLAPTVSAIPLVIRKRQVTHHLRLTDPPNLDRDWLGLLACVAHPLLQDNDPSAPGTRNIDSDLHIKGFANPGTNDVEWLMASIGITGCWTLVARSLGNRRGADTINAVVNRRNQIAHGDLESSVARIDVENYVSVLEAVCGEFDHLVGHHLTSCTGSPDPWAGL
jgi:RiboL-PSP-HEPN